MFLNEKYVREPENIVIVNATQRCLLHADSILQTAVDEVTENVITFSRPFARYGHIKIGSRATAIQYGNGHIAVFSPPRFTSHVECALRQHFGTTDVRYIMVLNSNHVDDIWEWGVAYPFAKIVVSEDVHPTRTKLGHRELDSHQWVTISSKNKTGFKTGDALFDSEFESMYLDHTPSKEVLWLHKPTKTLIEGEYFSNLPAHDQYALTKDRADRGLLTRINIKLNRMGDNRWARRVHWYGHSRLDRHTYNATAQRVFAWDFDRVIPCHGDVIPSGAREEFATLFTHHLHPANRQHSRSKEV